MKRTLTLLIGICLLAAAWGNLCAFAVDKPDYNPDMVQDAAGNTYVVWFDKATGTSAGQGNIFCQKFNATGTRVWTSDVKVNTGSPDWISGWELTPRILLANNELYILWADLPGKLVMQKLDINGNHLWAADKQINVNRSPEYLGHDMAFDGTAFIYIIFQQIGSSGRYSYCQKVDLNGTPQWAQDTLCGQGSSQTGQRIAVSASGNIFVANAGSVSSLMRINSSGVNVWFLTLPFGVHDIEGDLADGVIVAGRNGNNVVIQKYNATGTVVGSQIVASQGAVQPADISLDLDSGGNVYLAWNDVRTTIGFDKEVYFNKVSPAGTRVFAADVMMSDNDLVDQTATKVMAAVSGGAWVAWNEPYIDAVPNVFMNLATSAGVRNFANNILISEADQSPPNQPPVISSVPNVVFIVNQVNHYQVYASDPEGGPLTYSITSGPAGYAIDPLSGLVTWTPGGASVGTHNITIQVQDNSANTSTQTFVLTVIQPGVLPPRVKVESRQLVADFDTNGTYEAYLIKGVGYSPMPIGRHASDWGWPDANDPREDNIYNDPFILTRDFGLLQEMFVNTIRIWKGNDTTEADGRFPNKITQTTLDVAEAHGIRVIAGFWINTAQPDLSGSQPVYNVPDFTNDQVRADILNGFSAYVNQWKDHPAILFWAIGDENNFHLDPANQTQILAFYSLVNEMAARAHAIEGVSQHPVAFVNGETANIGDPFQGTDDASMPDLDIWGANVFRGDSFFGIFDDFVTRSGKPLWISAFGVDAWNVNDVNNPSNGTQRQDLQADWIGNMWDEIALNQDIAIGGCILEYSDEWWKPNEWLDGGIHNSAHDYFGAGPTATWTPPAPDSFWNAEWWGVMAISPNPVQYGPDIMTPRLVYTVMQTKFDPDNNPPLLDAVGDQAVQETMTLTIIVSAFDLDNDDLTLSAKKSDGSALSTIGADFTDNGDGTGVFEWTPELGQAGSYNIIFSATDGGLTDTESITILVTQIPIIPIEVTSPVPGSTLTTGTVTFNWTNRTDVTEAWIAVGTTQGGTQILSWTQVWPDLSKTVNNILLNGNPVYFDMWYRASGKWIELKATYQTPVPVPVELTSPAPGSTLTTSSVTFNWTNRTDVTEAWIAIGTTQGGTQVLTWTQVWPDLSKTVDNIPLNGNPVYFDMWYRASGKWVELKAAYLTQNQVGAIELTSPAPGSTLTTSSVTFNWTNRTDVTEAWIAVGTTQSGTQIFSWTQVWPNLSKTVNNIPLTGNQVYFEMWYRASGKWLQLKAAYPTQAPAPIAISSPLPESTLTAGTVTFNWTNRTDVTEAWIAVGTTQGGTQVLTWTQVWPDLSKTVNNIPLTGSPVYFDMWYRASGKWVELKATYQTSAP